MRCRSWGRCRRRRSRERQQHALKLLLPSSSRQHPYHLAALELQRVSQIVEAVQAAADTVGASSMRMISRGYHDSGLMAQVAPVGMVFIPCRCAALCYFLSFS